MMDKKRNAIIFSFLTVSYAIGLYFFYLRYVPLVKSFQLALFPVIFIVFVLTAINIQWGTLFFIFSFPLINNLPYFFGIFEHIPHASTSLVLFLFFFLGWLTHNIFFRSTLSSKLPIVKPMTLFLVFLTFSLIITFFRYSNFFPFLSDYIYEHITNVNEVTAGGAIMSSIFHYLNYLSAFVFFLILINIVKSREFIKTILIVLLISTSISLIFSFFQHLIDIKIANNPLSFKQGLINGTFKDALSFGAYLATLIPVVLSLIFFFKRSAKIIPLLILLPAFFILPKTGSRSGFVCMILSLFLFFVLLIKVNWKKIRFILTKRLTVSLVFLIIIVALIIVYTSSFQESIALNRFKELIDLNKPGEAETGVQVRWNYNWKMGAYMINDYPLSGVGIGAYIIELPNYLAAKGIQYRKTDSAENYFLQVGSELGLLALILILWIFWEILSHMKKSLGESLSYGRWKYIQIGISCAILSLFLNFFLHTYIGSYEMKYTFWLLTALLFCLSKTGKEHEGRFHVAKSFRVLSVIMIIIFTGIHLWNSTHSLSLKARRANFNLTQDFGLDKTEKTSDGNEFRWTRGYGGMSIKIEKPVIEISLLASHPDIEKNPVKVKILLIKDFFKQQKLLDEIILTQSAWKIYEYHVPEEVNQEVILLVKVSRTWNPLKVLGTPDIRNLGVAIGKIKFRESDGKEK
ncbi:MAG: O-antigen ligase family protein [Candidatus Aminicenantes bacterium]|nr:MAG: O-antigen ligase family protein [Candidatus Aminicenantes bacterium]